MSDNKFGTYIQKLMTTVLDKEEDEFVRDLAWSELSRLNININDFLLKHSKDDSKEREETEKMLLTETEEKKDDNVS